MSSKIEEIDSELLKIVLIFKHLKMMISIASKNDAQTATSNTATVKGPLEVTVPITLTVSVFLSAEFFRQDVKFLICVDSFILGIGCRKKSLSTAVFAVCE